MLQLAKTATPLRFIWTWPDIDVTALDPAMVIVCREPDGRWYVTFTADTDAPALLPRTGCAVGVDLGVKDFAVSSDAQAVANPRHLQRRARNLARYQRRLARCEQGGRNRRKAAAKVAQGSPGDACGGDVRHCGSIRMQSPAKQEPQPARAGIPILQGGE